jgi:hypothetical protein
MKTYNITVDGVTYIADVGQNKHDNWNCIVNSDPNDVWFHANGAPSAHVILRSPGNDEIPMSIIRFCASKIDNPDVIYTSISNIRKGRHVGEVVILDAKLVRRNIMRSYTNDNPI